MDLETLWKRFSFLDKYSPCKVPSFDGLGESIIKQIKEIRFRSV